MWAKCEIAFKTCLKGSGALGTAPDIGTFLKACWFTETVSGGVSVTYTPASINAASNPGLAYSIAVWIDGWRYALKGGLGDVNFTFNVGEPGIAEFKFSGAYVAPAAVANPLTTGSDATVPPTFLSAVVSLHAVTTVPIHSFSVNTGNKLGDSIKDANDSVGLLGNIITDREMNG